MKFQSVSQSVSLLSLFARSFCCDGTGLIFPEYDCINRADRDACGMVKTAIRINDVALRPLQD